MNPPSINHVSVGHREPVVTAGVVAMLGRVPTLLPSARAASDVESLLRGAEPAPCDLLITDFETAVAGLTAAGRSRPSSDRRPRVLVLTHLDREWDVRVAMESGAHGYLLQRCTEEELVSAVRAVRMGSRYVSAELAPKLADCLLRDDLTTRQLQVLRAMSTGASNKAISKALGIADGTVKAHVRAILSKVGATARTEAVAIATHRGLTSTPTPALEQRMPRYLHQAF